MIFISTPAFFLWALDAQTGKPLENWGRAAALEGLAKMRLLHDLGVLHQPLDGARIGAAFHRTFGRDHGDAAIACALLA